MERSKNKITPNLKKNFRQKASRATQKIQKKNKK